MPLFGKWQRLSYKYSKIVITTQKSKQLESYVSRVIIYYCKAFERLAVGLAVVRRQLMIKRS